MRTLIILVTVFLLFPVSECLAQDVTLNLLGDFQTGWHKDWMERKFGRTPTLYQVVKEDTNLVLMAESERSASGLWRMLDIHPGGDGKISWMWKVSNSLSDKTAEKTKRGDDYAARVFLIFEPHFISWKTRSICYVWAAKQPVGSIYRSPYAESVGTIVVQSGKENKGNWLREERDYVSDYEKVFGKPPEMITGIAIMVDTDNTGQSATAWFDDFVLEVNHAESDSLAASKTGANF